MYAISSYRGNRPTNIQTHKPGHRRDRLQYTAPQLASAQCNQVDDQIHTMVEISTVVIQKQSTGTEIQQTVLSYLRGL